MALSDFLSTLKVDKSNLHKIIPIAFDLQQVLIKYHIQPRCRAQKAWTIVGKEHRYDNTLQHDMKWLKAAEVLRNILSGINMTKLHLVTNPAIRTGLGRTKLRKKVPGTHQLVKQKVFSQSPLIPRPAFTFIQTTCT